MQHSLERGQEEGRATNGSSPSSHRPFRSEATPLSFAKTSCCSRVPTECDPQSTFLVGFLGLRQIENYIELITLSFRLFLNFLNFFVAFCLCELSASSFEYYFQSYGSGSSAHRAPFNRLPRRGRPDNGRDTGTEFHLLAKYASLNGTTCFDGHKLGLRLPLLTEDKSLGASLGIGHRP